MNNKIVFKSTINNGFQWLSNFQPCNIVYNDMQFKSVEHAYQTLKYLLHIDANYALNVLYPLQNAKDVKKAAGKGVYIEWLHTKTPSTSKQSKKLKFDLDLNKFKRHHSVNLMRSLLSIKFQLNPELAEKLKATNTARLEEQGRFSTDFWANTGQNMLGTLLEEIRSKLLFVKEKEKEK